MTKEQLIAQFNSDKKIAQVIQKFQFMALSDDDFKLLISIPKHELTIRCTPQAMRYLEARKQGNVTVKPSSGEPPKALDPDRAGYILDRSIMNPRGM